MTTPTRRATAAAALFAAALSGGPALAQFGTTGPDARNHPTPAPVTMRDDTGDGYYAYVPGGRGQAQNCHRMLVVINGHHSEWQYFCE